MGREVKGEEKKILTEMDPAPVGNAWAPLLHRYHIEDNFAIP